MRNDITPDLNMLEEQVARLKRQLASYKALVDMRRAIEKETCELRVGPTTYELAANDKTIKKVLSGRIAEGNKLLAATLSGMAHVVSEMQAEVKA